MKLIPQGNYITKFKEGDLVYRIKSKKNGDNSYTKGRWSYPIKIISNINGVVLFVNNQRGDEKILEFNDRYISSFNDKDEELKYNWVKFNGF